MKKYRLPRKEKKRRAKLVAPWKGSRNKSSKPFDGLVLDVIQGVLVDNLSKLLGIPSIKTSIVMPGSNLNHEDLMFNTPEGYKVFDNSWEQDPDKVKQVGMFIPACDSFVQKLKLTPEEVSDRYGIII